MITMRLKTCKDAKIHYNDFEDLRAKGIDASQYHNAPMTLEHKKREIIIGCGRQDENSVFEDGSYLYLVSTHTSLNYCALTIYCKKDLSEIGKTFAQDYELEDILHVSNVDHRSHITIAKILSEYIY